MSRPSPQELAEQFSDFVNLFGDNGYDEFVDAFCLQHRTLQQSMFGLMMRVVERVASDDYRTDGRNEACHNMAKLLVKGYKDALKKDLMERDSFWTEERAEKHVNSFSLSNLPMI